jgi:hypothetical protein
MRDIYHNVKVNQVLSPVVSTTTKTSTAIDLKGFNSAMVAFAIGQTGDTLSGSIYWTLKIQHSEDNVDYTDVTTADLHNSAATSVVNSNSLDETVYNFGYKGAKRYLKAVATPTGSHSSGTPVAIIAVLGDASYNPVI